MASSSPSSSRPLPQHVATLIQDFFLLNMLRFWIPCATIRFLWKTVRSTISPGISSKTARPNPDGNHWILSGTLLASLLPRDLGVIAEGSLLNKVLPSKKEYHLMLSQGLQQWTRSNDCCPIPKSQIQPLHITFGTSIGHQSQKT